MPEMTVLKDICFTGSWGADNVLVLLFLSPQLKPLIAYKTYLASYAALQ